MQRGEAPGRQRDRNVDVRQVSFGDATNGQDRRMKSWLQIGLAAWLWVAYLPDAAAAQSVDLDMVDASDPERLVDIIRDLGYRAQLDTDDVGDPLIRSSVGGTRFAIVFYGCDATRHDGCNLLLFKVGYDLADGIGLDRINQWNATQLIGRAYRDEVDDPWLEMPLVLANGISRGNLESMLEWWESSVLEFERHLGVESPGEANPGVQQTGRYVTLAPGGGCATGNTEISPRA